MVAGAKECPVDRAGRTLVPPELREFAGLKKDVVITGALEQFEIWSRDRWTDHRQTLRGGFDEMTRKLSERGVMSALQGRARGAAGARPRSTRPSW